MAVADDLRGDIVGLQHRAGEARCAMMERRHAVEEMRGLPRARRHRRDRFLVGRARVPERHAMAARGEQPHQIQTALELGRQRDDADVGRRALDLGEDVAGGEVAVGRPGAARRQIDRTAQAGRRLRAVVVRVDEVALEMRRQHARRALLRLAACPPHLIEHAAQRRWSARDRCRTEGGDTVARQSRGDRADRLARVERVEAVDAVDVDVDEAGHDVVTVEREHRVRRR